MKKTKKVAALFLAMMMALSCMAMPAMAHAHGDDGIMPMYDPNRCPRCGREAYYSNGKKPDGTLGIWVTCINSDCGYTGWL